MDPKVAARLQQEMTDESKRMAESGKKLQLLLSQRQKLLTQQSENEMVETELRSLQQQQQQQKGQPEAKAGQLWKLVGPVLVKVELEEAQANVQGRSQFFKDEIARLERQQKEAEDSRRSSQEKLMRMQESVRKAQQEAVQSRLAA